MLSAREARSYRVTQPSVVEVIQVERDSAARRAGLRDKDLVLGINDRPVTSVEALLRCLSERNALNAVVLTIGRRGQRISIELVPDRRTSV